MTPVAERAALLDDLFAASPALFGGDLLGYRHHCYRVLNFALALAPVDSEARSRLEIAVYFHDLGIWSDGTFDYLPPSVDRATTHLGDRGLAGWTAEVVAMIAFHHQITDARRHGASVEAFRRADLIDVSLGALRFGLARSFVAEVRRAFPNAGFHRRLLQLAAQRAWRHPRSPFPMIRW